MSGELIKLLADYIVIPLVIIATVTLLYYPAHSRKFEVYSRILVAGLTGYLVAKLLATVYQPTGLRPFELLGTTAGASYLNNPGFPSDHALFVWSIAFAVWFGTRSKLWTTVCMVLALLVCVGRVLALVHTPLDVVGGVAAAAVGGLWYLDAYKAKLAKKH